MHAGSTATQTAPSKKLNWQLSETVSIKKTRNRITSMKVECCKLSVCLRSGTRRGFGWLSSIACPGCLLFGEGDSSTTLRWPGLFHYRLSGTKHLIPHKLDIETGIVQWQRESELLSSSARQMLHDKLQRCGFVYLSFKVVFQIRGVSNVNPFFLCWFFSAITTCYWVWKHSRVYILKAACGRFCSHASIIYTWNGAIWLYICLCLILRSLQYLND